MTNQILKPNYTPGPWVIVDCRTKDQFNHGHLQVASNIEGVGITKIDFKSQYSEDWQYESESNAKLISAAPELVEACIVALEELESCASYNDYTDPKKKVREALSKALNKAGVIENVD